MELEGLSLAVKYSKDFPSMLMASCEFGNIYIVNTFDYDNVQTKATSNLPLPKIKPTMINLHSSPLFDIEWHDNSSKVLTGSGDLSCGVYDLNKSMMNLKLHGHTKSVRSLASCLFNPNLFASGGRDGSIFLWDVRLAQKEQSLFEKSCSAAIPIEMSTPEVNSVTGVSFYIDEQTLISTQCNQE